MRAESLGFPLTFDVDGMTVLLVGAVEDADAVRKRALLENSGALVRQVAPGAFADGDVDGARLVLVDRARAGAGGARGRWRRGRGTPSSGAATIRRSRTWPCRRSRSSGRCASRSRPAARLRRWPGRLRALLEAQLGARFGRFVSALAERRKLQDVDARRTDLDGLQLTLSVRYPAWLDAADNGGGGDAT